MAPLDRLILGSNAFEGVSYTSRSQSLHYLEHFAKPENIAAVLAAAHGLGVRTFMLSSTENILAALGDQLADPARVSKEDRVFVFFAGHGVQLGGANFLLPVDIRGESEEQVRELAAAGRLLGELQQVVPRAPGALTEDEAELLGKQV